MRRHHGSLHGRRHVASLQRGEHGLSHRGLRPSLLLLHFRAHLHRRRQCHGLTSWFSRGRSGIRPVPSDRHLRRGLPHHGRLPRRGRHPPEFRGRTLHGALRALRQRPRLPGRRFQVDDRRDTRRPWRRQKQRPHLPPPRPLASRVTRGAVAGHLRNGGHLRRRRRDQGTYPRPADCALFNGRRPDEPLGRSRSTGQRWGPGQRRRPRQRRPGPLRRRGSRLRLRPRREPPRRQLFIRHRRLRPSLRAAHRRHRRKGQNSPPPFQRRRPDHRRPRRHPPRRRTRPHSRHPRRHAEDHARPRRRLPNGRTPHGRRRQNRRRRQVLQGRRHQGPLPHLEHRPRRNPRTPQPPPERSDHHARRRSPQGISRGPRTRGLPRPPRRLLDETHHGLRRRQ
mmetsp:Transcript_27247/g.88057  ORF Transcript_27247/g.88057 Transcript_27247/m.88057 type:complete len:394 (+) Transcript_27247:733-1914(+)